MFESRISVRETNKLPHSENPRTSSRSHDTEGQAKKCVERYFESAKKKKWNLLENCHQYALKLFSNADTWHELDDLIFYGQ